MKLTLLVIPTIVLSLLLANAFKSTPASPPPPCGSLHQVMHFYGYLPSELDTIVMAWYQPNGSFNNLLGSQNIFLNELPRDYTTKRSYYLSGHPAPVTIFDNENPIDSIELWNDHLVPQYESTGRLCDMEVILLPANRRVRFSNIRLAHGHMPVVGLGCNHHILSCSRDDGGQGYLEFVKKEM
jgi:hypothetical protein